MERLIEKNLKNWKERAHRQPLLITGARQVGKTYILKEFGKQFFSSTLYIDLESNRDARAVFEGNLVPERIMRLLEAITGERFLPGESLLILDGIQSCNRALTALKYFCEEAPTYHVAAAGTLLGFADTKENFSFPVGKVDMLPLYPLTFEEFLWARGFDTLANRLMQHMASLEKLPDDLHTKALKLYREYLTIGGMPSAVKEFTESGNFLVGKDIHTSIITRYIADMVNYSSAIEITKIRSCFLSIPTQLAKENKKFQYKIVKFGGTASFFGPAVDWITAAGIVLKSTKIKHAYTPIEAYLDVSSFKLYLNDVGLLVSLADIPQASILGEQENHFIRAITENYVAQQLAAHGHKLRYWASQGRAEVDFVLQGDANSIGIEVKSGVNVRSRSLNVFCGKYGGSKPIRLSLRNFGTDGNLMTIPLYAAFAL